MINSKTIDKVTKTKTEPRSLLIECIKASLFNFQNRSHRKLEYCFRVAGSCSASASFDLWSRMPEQLFQSAPSSGIGRNCKCRLPSPPLPACKSPLHPKNRTSRLHSDWISGLAIWQGPHP